MHTFELYNSYKIPVIGYGTFPQKETLENNVPIAYNAGYRMIDASDNYFNEEFVGTGIGRIGSANIIVVSKFSQPMRTEVFEKCFSESFEKLQCPDVKKRVYLLHWPFPYLWKKEWRKMEDLYLSGNCAAIGVCNFDVGYLKELLRFCRVKPMINQFERHPLFQQNELVDLCKQENIQVMSYSPLARMDDELNNNLILKRIADKYGKTVNQIILRWNIDTKCIPIPASSSEPHIKENIDVFDFKLTDNEIAEINSLDRGKRIRYNPRTRFDKKTRKTFRIESFRLKSHLTAKIINIQEKVSGKLKSNMKRLYTRIKSLFSALYRLFANADDNFYVYIDNSGFVNKGDQLMIESIVEQVRKWKPDSVVLLKKSAFYQNVSYCYQNKILPLQEPCGRLHKFRMKLAFDVFLNKRLYVTPNQIDLVLDARGFQFGDSFAWRATTKGIIGSHNYYKSFSKKGRKIVFLPQAFGPFNMQSTRTLIRQVYEFADVIYVRDNSSYNYLVSAIEDVSRVKIAPDFTALLKPTIVSSVVFPANKYIVVIVNARMLDRVGSEVSNLYKPFIIEVLNFLIDRGEYPILLNHEGADDERLMFEINKMLSKPIPILTQLSGVEIKSIIRDCKLLISSRYHGVVSGLTQSVPTLCTSWSHKYEELLEEHKCKSSMLSVTDINFSKQIVLNALEKPNDFCSKNNDEIEAKIDGMWKEIFSIA